MEIIYILIPVSLILLGVAIWGFFWAVRSGQFDDLDSPAYRVLMEEQKGRGESDRKNGAQGGHVQEDHDRDT